MSRRGLITKKQKVLLDFVDSFIRGNGYSPTYREIMRALGYRSVSTVARHVDGLVASGHLAKVDGAVRSLILNEVEVVSHSDCGANNPCVVGLEDEIKLRQKTKDPEVQKELEILQKALEIVKKP